MPVSETAVVRRGRDLAAPMRIDSLEAARISLLEERRPDLREAEARVSKASVSFAILQESHEKLTEQLRVAVHSASDAVAAQKQLTQHTVAARNLGRHALPWIAGLGGLTCAVVLLLSFGFGMRCYFGSIASGNVALVAVAGWLCIPPGPNATEGDVHLGDTIARNVIHAGRELVEEEKLGAQLESLWFHFDDSTLKKDKKEESKYRFF
jgi:hypothetical protein